MTGNGCWKPSNMWWTQKGDSFEVEYRILPLTGSMRWLLARGWVTRNKKDEALRVLSAHMDITDRIRTERALRASEMRYLTILENTVDGVLRVRDARGPGGTQDYRLQRRIRLPGRPGQEGYSGPAEGRSRRVPRQRRTGTP